MSLRLVLLGIASICCIALMLVKPKILRVLIVASTVLVTANPAIPLHLIPQGLVALYCLSLPWNARRVRGSHKSFAVTILCLFVAAIAVAWIFAVPNDYESSFNTAFRLFMHLAIFGILALQIANAKEWTGCVLVYVGVVTGEALFGMMTYLSSSAHDLIGFGAGYITELGSRRLTGIHGDPNFFAVLIATAILLALGSFPAFRDLKPRVYLAVALSILILSLLLTLSRTGAIALAAGVVAWAAMIRKKRLAFVAVVLLAGMIGSSFLESGLGHEAIQRLDLGTSWSRRLGVWENISRRLTVTQIVSGGLGASRGGMTPHQTYLGLLLETGVLGSGAYLAAILVPVLGYWRYCRRRSTLTRTHNLAAAAAAAVVGLASAGFALDLMSEKGTWVVLGLMAAIYRLARNERDVAARPVYLRCEPVANSLLHAQRA